MVRKDFEILRFIMRQSAVMLCYILAQADGGTEP
jgi:hypothetical protein